MQAIYSNAYQLHAWVERAVFALRVSAGAEHAVSARAYSAKSQTSSEARIVPTTPKATVLLAKLQRCLFEHQNMLNSQTEMREQFGVTFPDCAGSASMRKPQPTNDGVTGLFAPVTPDLDGLHEILEMNSTTR